MAVGIPFFRTLCDDYPSAEGGTRRQIRGSFQIRVPDPSDPSRTLFSPPEQFLFDTGAEFSAVSEGFAADYGFADFRTAGRLTTVRGFDESGPPRRGWLVPRWVRFRDHDHDLQPAPNGDGIPHLMFRIHFLVIEGVVIDVPILGLTDSHAYFTLGSSEEEYWFILKASGDGVRELP